MEKHYASHYGAAYSWTVDRSVLNFGLLMALLVIVGLPVVIMVSVGLLRPLSLVEYFTVGNSVEVRVSLRVRSDAFSDSFSFLIDSKSFNCSSTIRWQQQKQICFKYVLLRQRRNPRYSSVLCSNIRYIDTEYNTVSEAFRMLVMVFLSTMSYEKCIFYWFSWSTNH